MRLYLDWGLLVNKLASKRITLNKLNANKAGAHLEAVYGLNIQLVVAVRTTNYVGVLIMIFCPMCLSWTQPQGLI